MKSRKIAPFLFRDNSQRAKNIQSRVNKAVLGSRKFAVEPLEPRLLLSADAVLAGLNANLATGLTAVGTEISQLLETDPLLNFYVPGIVEQRTTSDGKIQEVSPTLGEAMSISVDTSDSYTGGTGLEFTGSTLLERFQYMSSGSLATIYSFFGGDSVGDEAALKAIDINGDSQASADEVFKVFVVGRLQSYLPGTTITDHDGDLDVDVLDLGKQISDFLESSSFTTTFGVPDSLTDRVAIDIDSVTSTVKNDALTFDADYSISLFQRDRFDLGYEADKLGILLDPGTPPNPNPNPFKLPVSSVIDFGSFIFGFTGVGDGHVDDSNSEFFFAAPDRPSDANDGVRIGVNVGSASDPYETINGSFIGVNVGFLGAHVVDPDGGNPTDSGVVLNMNLTGSAVDPSNVIALGFSPAQQGSPQSGGSIEAQNVYDSSSIATTDIQFTLKIGNDPLHAETELTLPHSAYANSAAIVAALNTAIGGSALAGLVTAADGDSDSKVEFNLVASDPTLLGFSNEAINTGIITAANVSSLIGVGKSIATVKFLLSVNGTFKLVTVNVTVDADGADNLSGTPAEQADDNAITIDSLVINLQTALTAAFGGGVTAGKTGSNRLTITGAGKVEISKTLTLDTLERISLTELQAPVESFEMVADTNASFTVALKLLADSGLQKQDNTDYRPFGTIKVNVNPFTPNAVKPITIDNDPLTNAPVIRASYALTDKNDVLLKDGSSDLQTLLDFNVISVADVLGTFDEIGTWFSRLAASNLLQGFDLPFGQTTLGDILNFKDLINDTFLIDDKDDGPTKSGGDVDVAKLLQWVGPSGKEKLVALFGNAQQLETRLNALLGMDVDGTVFVDSDGHQNLTYTVHVADSTLDVQPNTAGDQPLVVPLDFQLNLDPVANFQTTGKLTVTGKGEIGFTVGVILGSSVKVLDDTNDVSTPSTPLTSLNSDAGVTINTNFALTTTGIVTPLVGRLSADAFFTLTLLESGIVTNYQVTVSKAQTDENTTLAQLLTDINASLATAGLGAKIQAVAEPMQGSTVSSRILLQALLPAVQRFMVTSSTNNTASTELGFQTQAAATVSLIASKPVAAANPNATFNFTVTIFRDGGTASTVIHFTPSDTNNNVSLQSLIDDINAKLPSGIIASQANGFVALSAVDTDIRSFTVTSAPALGLDLTAANDLLQAAGVTILPTEFVAGVQWRGGAAPGDPFGRLAADAPFSINGEGVNVTAVSTASNASVDDLVRSVNAAIELNVNLKGKVAAINDGGRISLRSINSSIQSITVAGLGGSQSTALGFGNGSTTGKLAIRSVINGPVSYGVSENLDFTVTINGTDYLAHLTRDNTIRNRSLFDLAASLNNALNLALGGFSKNPLVATVQAGQIVIGLKTSGASTNLIGDPSSEPVPAGGIRPVDVTGFSINSLNSKFATELKLITAANVPNVAGKIDFIIYFRNGTQQSFDLDSLDTDVDQKLDKTLFDLIAAIKAAAPGRIDVVINTDGTSLKLIDLTAGPNLFRVVAVNGSPAAAQLGILGSDVSNLNVGEVHAGSVVPDGVIDGGKLATIDLRDRFYLENAGASAELTVKTQGVVSAEATFGFAGIKISSTADQTLFSATADLPILDAKVTLRELFSKLGNPTALHTLIGDPTLTLSGDFSFTVTTFPDASALIGGTGSATIKFDTDSVVIGLDQMLPPTGELVPDLGIDIETLNFGDLAKFDKIEFGNVIDALQAIATFLKQFQSFDFLDGDIPVLGVSVNDLIDLADNFQKAVDDFRDHPAGGIQVLAQKIQEALGLPNFANTAARDAFFAGLGIDASTIPSGLNQLIQFAIDGDVLRFELRLPIGFNKGLKVDLDLGDALGTGLPVDIQGGANLAASGFLDARLTFGIDLNTPTNLLIYDDSTGIFGGLHAGALNLQFNAAIGPIGVFVKDGSVDLDLGVEVSVGDGLAPPEIIDLTDPSSITDFLLTLSPSLTGNVAATLPVYFPSDSEYFGDITFSAGLTLDGSDGLDITGVSLDVPDLSNIDLSSINPFNSIPQMLDALDFFLQNLQDIMDGKVFGVELPLVGDQLKGAANFIEDLRRDVLAPIRKYAEQAPQLGMELVQKLLYSLLGPGSAGVMVPSLLNPSVPQALSDFLGLGGNFAGLNLLKDYDSSDGDGGAITFQDIVASEDAEHNFQWLFRLGQSFKPNVNIDFDLGVPALSLDMDVELNITINWDLALGLGIGPTDGAYIFIGDQRGNDAAGDDELTISVEVDLAEESSLTGSLGFLQLEINESDTTDPLLENSGPSGRNTFIAAQFGVDLQNGSDPSDDRLSFSELGSVSAAVSLSAEAEVNLDLVARFNPDIIPDAISALLPEVSARFVLDWSSGNLLDASTLDFGSSLSLVGFRDVDINMGSFINDFLKPFVDKIAEVTAPLQPIIDVITAPIPVISDLAGQPISLVDIAGMTGTVDPGMIYAIADIISLVNKIGSNSFGDFSVPLGDFLLIDTSGTGSGSSLLSGGDIMKPGYNVSKDPQFDKDNLAAAVATAKGVALAGIDALLAGGSGDSGSEDLVSGLHSGTEGGAHGFAFPLFDNPSLIFGLLLGKDIPLVTYDLAPFTMDFSYTQKFPVWDALFVRIGGSAGLTIDFSFGYDTHGVREFAEGGFSNPLDLLSGFYISDTDQPTGEGTDVPELILKGELFAGAELNLGIASAGADGIIGLEVDFNLYDPDSDGKVRVDELLGNFLYEFNYGSPLLAPLAIFDVTGIVYAQLKAFVEALFFKYEFNITPKITLVEFSIPFEREPFLATERGDGSLLLNIGPNSAQRLNQDTRDLDEKVFVKSISDSEVLVWNGTTVREGDAQQYHVDPSKGIFGYGGHGNDEIDLSQVTANIIYTLEGGEGDDIIKGSAGGGSIDGGTGNDDLAGGAGVDYIYGGEGNDTIDGKGSADFLFGDTGIVRPLNDETYDPDLDADTTEDPFGDRLRSFVGAQDGDDHILGGDGADIIFGGGGNDTIEGQGGNDVVIGDGGNFDRQAGNLIRLGADAGNRLDINARGTGGKDTIFGNDGEDVLFGGASDDLVDGGAGIDEIDGGAGFDTIYGGSAADTIYGGSESDIIFGERDPQGAFFGQPGDTLDGGAAGIDTIFGEDGNDYIRGNGNNDVIRGGRGADILFGDTGDDQLFGEAGGDIMYGGANNDTLDGSEGSDIAFGDDGLVVYFEFSPTVTTFDFTGSRIRYVDGDGDGKFDQLIGDSDKTLRDAYAALADELQTSQDLIVTKTLATDGSDTIIGGNNNDIVFGGGGLLDKLFGDFDPVAGFSGPRPSGQDILIGDGGRIELEGRRNERAAAESGGFDGNDNVSGNDGGDYIFGGGFNDNIHGFQVDSPTQPLGGVSENDVIVGDNGEIKFDIGDAKNRVKSVNTTAVFGDSGRSDIIDGDFGNDIVFGGLNGSSDVITGDVGDDILLGDNGEVRFDLDGDFDTLDKIESYRDGLGGTDTISGNDGNDVLIGGTDADTMFGNNGEDVMLGDNARIDVIGLIGRLLLQVAAMPFANSVDFITTTDTAEGTGGADEMSGNAGNDILFGGVNKGGTDVMYGDAVSPVNALDGDDILVGDDGFLDFTLGGNTDRSTLDLIRSTRDGLGGPDTISGNAGSDIAIGGTAGDLIYGDNAAGFGGSTDLADVLIGDNVDIFTAGPFGGPARLKALGTAISLIQTTDTVEGTGGSDTIFGSAASDVILGGVGADILNGDSSTPVNGLDSSDVLLGDNGELSFADDRTLSLTPTTVNLTTLDRITSYLDGLGGIDTISGNAGSDTVLGGTAGDIIYGDNAAAGGAGTDLADILLGDNGELILVNPAFDVIANGSDRILILGGAVASIKTRLDTALTGGADTISGNAGGDIALGGVYGDTIYGDRASVTSSTNVLDGNDILLGDNGALEWLSTGRLGEITGIDLPGNNAALVAGFATRDANLDTLDLITTEQPNSGGRDLIFGDNKRDVIFGGTDADRLHGDSGDLDAIVSSGGNDLMFGDHGRLYPQFSVLSTIYSRNFFAIDISNTSGGEGDEMWGEEGDDIMLGQQGDDRMWGGSQDDDMMGGHNVSGGYDELTAPAILATLVFSPDAVNDLMDGGSGDDAMTGDNAIVWRRGDDTNPRFRLLLAGLPIYTTTGDIADVAITANVGSIPQSDPDDAIGRDIELVDHSDAVQITPLGRFGADVMAGGADSDLMFGELGNDLMQGDGNIALADDGLSAFITRQLNVSDSGSNPDTDQTLFFNIPELSSDADDYMEGNGGNDLMYGGLGQDDMIGGNSSLFGLTTEAMRPDGSDTIFGGAGAPARLVRNDFVGSTDTDHGTADGVGAVPTANDPSISIADRHSRDADFIMGDNANVFRLVNATDDFLQFNYDKTSTFEDRGTHRIVPRAMQQLDYTLGGANYHAGVYENGAAHLTGQPADNGAGDLIHGESGDDYIFGMTGSDVIYGESDDDDIIGGYGNDWISGGTGSDGVLGDDGLIFTSRNSTTGEPLYGVAGLLATDTTDKYSNGNALDELITTPGDIQYAVINVTGRLKKTVEIVPFSYDPNWHGTDDEFPNDASNVPFADDIIFGGLGSDWLHGGSGDDAISGAEALEHAYVPKSFDADGNPHGILDLGYNSFDDLTPPINPGDIVTSPNPGDVLAFNPDDIDGRHLNNRFRAGEFFLYDEYEPLRKILLDSTGNLWKSAAQGAAFEFILNFDETEGVFRDAGTVPKATGQQTESYPVVQDDGTDAIFGDTGNDWLVGGTGRDDIYGGWGNDLLNADDNHDSHGDLNDQPDTHPTYEDRAYGGAGRDVLIANTGGDRLIDWVGEYNSYLVPYAPFGEASVSRTMQPFLPEFLYALSSGDGADPTRYRDAFGGNPPAPTNNNPNPSRNGEPNGELGLVLQKDFAWGDQTGAPADPQAGNIPGGPRDVLRTANFNDGTASAFFADSGTWSVTQGSYQVAPESLGGDASSVFFVNQYIPQYFEMLATLNAVKPTGGYKSNAYVIFDYQSETDFKFAGINVSTNKLEIGHRTDSGWIIDKQGSVQSSLRSDTNYNVFLSFNGSVVTMIVDNTYTLTFTFAPRVDFFGFSHGLNDGMVGLGANNSKAKIDNVSVQRLAPQYTYIKTVDFSNGTTSLLLTPESGIWPAVSNGRYTGTSSGSTPAIDLISLVVSPSAVTEMSATFSVSAEGGFVFDHYDAARFKFVTISAGKITLGHHTSKGWFVDATYTNTTLLKTGVDLTLGLVLKGTTVSVTINGQLALSYVYNALVGDGDFGLLSRTGTTSFDTLTVKSDDASLLSSSSALTASDAGTHLDGSLSLTEAQVAGVAGAALKQWSDSSVSGTNQDALKGLRFQLVNDLPGNAVAWSIGDGTILIDVSAAGHGWFVDSTPFSSQEYLNVDGKLTARSSTAASGRIDLLTVLEHEIGHVLGFEHGADDLMGATLQTGIRILENSVDSRQSIVWDSDFLGIGFKLGRQNGAGFPEFTFADKSESSSSGQKKKRMYEEDSEVSLSTEESSFDWYVEV